MWAYLNWALGLRALGWEIIWLELVDHRVPGHEVAAYAAALRSCLDRYGLGKCLALSSVTGEPLPDETAKECLDLDAAIQADLLLNMRHDPSPGLIQKFRRSAFLDIDPGILQFWMAKGVINLAPHNVYFIIGEHVEQLNAMVPESGVQWQYSPPCVALDYWTTAETNSKAPFTTISHWYSNLWMEDMNGGYSDDKRTSFLPFLDLPQQTVQPMELALCLNGDEFERKFLKDRGWRVCEAWRVSSTPWDYQRYIQGSYGEFSCAKPSYIRFQNVWISDRTLCYLACGKPVVVQYTGPSRFLPQASGLFRFRTFEEAARSLEAVAADYDQHCGLARKLAEEHFDARKIVGRVLSQALS
jgi:hypothetical protein